MSVVVGVAENGKVTLGADSLLANGWTIYETHPPKVFKHPCGMLIGVTGDARAGAVVRYHFDPPRAGDLGDDEYMSTLVAKHLKDSLTAHSVTRDTTKDDDRATEMLIGYNGGLYYFHASGFVNKLTSDYGAIGSGGDVALGAVAAGDGAPKVRVRKALTIAERHNMGVRGPFVFVSGQGTPRKQPTKITLGEDYLTP